VNEKRFDSATVRLAYQEYGSHGASPLVPLHAMHETDRVERLIVEDACPPFRREDTLPERPAGPLEFDWPVVPAIRAQVSAGDPAMWDGLAAIGSPTLLIGGGPESHVPQDLLAETAARIPDCTLVTIPTGHNVHTARPVEFVDVVLDWHGA
jgi:pimeloyl-ACP methyl ester carboxylesterase